MLSLGGPAAWELASVENLVQQGHWRSEGMELANSNELVVTTTGTI